MKNVKYGKCVRCGRTYEAKPDLTNCECGGILDIVYDYDYIKTVLTKEKLAKRENRSMWRYRELLPVEETAGDASGGTYTVKRGDTLWGIAKRFGVNLTALIAANPQIKNPNLIYSGNEVRLP